MRRALPLLALALAASVAATGCKLPRRKKSSSSDPYPIPTYTAPTPTTDDDDPLPTGAGATAGTYTPASGLLELHFPRDFEAQADSTNLTFVVPKKGARSVSASCPNDCLVAFTTIESASSVDRLTDTLQKARADALPNYALVSRKKTVCFKDNPGVEVVWTHVDAGTKMRSRACIFVKDGKGYSFMYGLPQSSPSRDLAALQGVVEGTVLL